MIERYGQRYGSGSRSRWLRRIRNTEKNYPYPRWRWRSVQRVPGSRPGGCGWRRRGWYLDYYCFVNSSWLFIFQKWCKCSFKKNKQKNLKVTSKNSRIQVPDLLNRGTDPHQNVTDPQHWFWDFHLYELFTDEAALSLKLSLWLPKVEMEMCSARALFSAWRVWVEEARLALILGYLLISSSTPSHFARTESQNHGPNIYKDTKP